MENIYRGSALVVPGSNINTDTAMDWFVGMEGLAPEEIASKFMCNADASLAKLAKPGDILVCGKNFGYGKVHSCFFIAFKTLKLSCIVAESFSSQIFAKLKVEGIPFVECPGIASKVKTGTQLEVHFAEAVVKDLTADQEYTGNVLPPYILEVMQSGGIMSYLAKKGKALNQQ